MMKVSLTPDFLAPVAGAVLSLAFAYIPGLKRLYDPLSGEWKRVIMALLLLIVAAATYGLGCAGIIQGIDCSQNGLIQLVQVFVLAMMANQSTYSLAVPQKPKKQPKIALGEME